LWCRWGICNIVNTRGSQNLLFSGRVSATWLRGCIVNSWPSHWMLCWQCWPHNSLLRWPIHGDLWSYV
jgi:hypothetical protein